MDAVIFPTIMETCLGCFYLRGRTFILYQIQRDDFPFVDEGWFYYFLKHKFRILWDNRSERLGLVSLQFTILILDSYLEYGEGLSVESIHNRRHHLLFLSQQLSYGHVSYFLCLQCK